MRPCAWSRDNQCGLIFPITLFTPPLLLTPTVLLYTRSSIVVLKYKNELTQTTYWYIEKHVHYFWNTYTKRFYDSNWLTQSPIIKFPRELVQIVGNIMKNALKSIVLYLQSVFVTTWKDELDGKHVSCFEI